MIALALAGTLAASGIAVANHQINDRVASIKRVNLQIAAEPPEGANYLIIGSDIRNGEELTPEEQLAFCDPVKGCDGSHRSDTLMVAHVEPGSRRTLVVSFPRDLLVRIPNHGTARQKINGAYSYGGPQLVIDTLMANFGIPIHHYLEVGFKTFKEIVDAIGSVRVGFNYPTRDLQFTGLNVPAGCVALGPDDALAYVRARSIEEFRDGRWRPAGEDAPDIHRIERQQAFIRKLAGLAIEKSLDDPRLAITITDRVLAHLTADQDLDRGNVNALIRAFRTIDANDTRALDFQTLPWKPFGSADLEPAPGYEAMIAKLVTFGNDPQPATSVVPSSVHLKVVDGTGGQSNAEDAARLLTSQGFVASAGARAKRVDVSEIRYRPDQLGAARLLAEFVEDARLIADETITTAKVTLVLGGTFKAITATTTTTRAPGATTPATTTTLPAVTTTTRPSTTTTLPDPCA